MKKYTVFARNRGAKKNVEADSPKEAVEKVFPDLYAIPCQKDTSASGRIADVCVSLEGGWRRSDSYYRLRSKDVNNSHSLMGSIERKLFGRDDRNKKPFVMETGTGETVTFVSYEDAGAAIVVKDNRRYYKITVKEIKGPVR